MTSTVEALRLANVRYLKAKKNGNEALAARHLSRLSKYKELLHREVVGEAVLDELSAKTLTTYVKKAVNSPWLPDENLQYTHAAKPISHNREKQRQLGIRKAILKKNSKNKGANMNEEYKGKYPNKIKQVAIVDKETHLTLNNGKIHKLDSKTLGNKIPHVGDHITHYVPEKDWDDSMNEKHKQLEELSKSTLGKYVNAASVDMWSRGHNLGKKRAASAEIDRFTNRLDMKDMHDTRDKLKKATDSDSESIEKERHKGILRSRGITNAVKKLTKEETEMNTQTYNLIDTIDSGKSVNVESTFNEIMANKLANAIDNHRIEIARGLFDEAVVPVEEQDNTDQINYHKNAEKI